MPREFSRGHRVADQIRRDLAILIQREVKDPRVTMVTMPDAKVSRDLSVADVYFTMLGEAEAAEAEALLNNTAGYLRSLLAKGLSSRTTPKLKFHYDESIARGAHLSKAIDQARARDSNDVISDGSDG